MIDDDTGENEFRDLPIDKWLPEPEGSPLEIVGPDLPERPITDVGPARRRSRRTVITSTLAVLVLVAAGFAAWRLLGSEGNGSEDGADGAGEVGSDPVAAATTTDPEDSVDGAPITPPDSGSNAPDSPSPNGVTDLPTLGVFDSFSRSDSGNLGFAESGREWVEVAGAWSIESGSAVVSEPNSDGPSIAVSNTRTTRSIVQVTMPSVERAAGLVFRYSNPYNYWAMTAAPESGTWAISQVTQGESVVRGNLGPAMVDDNTTIAVRCNEDSMDFFVNGTMVKSIVSSDPINGTYAGLIGRGPGTADARWVNFVAVALAEPKPGT